MYICTGRPNAFVSIRIPSSQIRSKLEEIQQAMVEFEPSLKSSMVSLDKLHVTLMVLKLNQEDIEK